MVDCQPPAPPGPPAEDSFRSLFDFLPIGAYRASPDGTLLRANPALVRLNGYEDEPTLLRALVERGNEWYVDPARRERFRERLERDGQVRAFVSEVRRHRTGERIWVSENAHLVRDEHGGIVCYEGTVEEVTARVLAQSDLQRNLEHLRQIAEHIPGMVYRVHYPPQAGAAPYYTFVSAGVRQLYGVDPAAVLADPVALRPFRDPRDAERVDQEARAAVEQALPLVASYRIVVDGKVKWVQMSSSAAIAEDGEQVRVGVMLDVTAQREAEALLRARDRAEGARQQMTQFLSRVSHELRTPLNAILGFAQLIEMEADTPPAQRRWSRALLESGRHLLDLVTDVLDLSGAQSGQMVFDLAPVDLAEVLAEAWAMVAAEAAERGLHFGGIPADPGWAIVLADRRRLLQVATNLLSNAVKYNVEGGRIDLALRPLPSALELDVADTGGGMTAAQLARLFSPFDRLGAQRGSVQGTGLGLALSRQLAIGMSGSIAVESEPGRGSTFTLRLPRART